MVANVYARREGVLGDRHPGGLARLAIVVGLLALMALLWRRWPRSAAVQTLREVLPFVACILIYTNLHDTIGFVNRHDVHHYLDALDREIFGVQPVVWAERFITPAAHRGDAVPLHELLLDRALDRARSCSRGSAGRSSAPRPSACSCASTSGTCSTCCSRPRRRGSCSSTTSRTTCSGYPSVFSTLSARAFELLPVDSRAAFPSLHAAVSLVALVYAWRYLRPWFYVLLPFVLGLWVSTIYLRHHYTVDLLAGWMLAPAALALAPRLDAWWARRQASLGLPSARGAQSGSPART